MIDEEEREFQRLWGPWAVPTPAEAASLFQGFPQPWWISGGWAIEAFAGLERPHKDVDATSSGGTSDPCGSTSGDGTTCGPPGSRRSDPLDNRRPRPPSWSEQVWVREHALSPWVLDVQLNPGSARRWVFKRARTVIGTLDDATWVARDGLRYLRPELVLAHKARLARRSTTPTSPRRFPCSTPGACPGCVSTSRARACPTPGGRCSARR